MDSNQKYETQQIAKHLTCATIVRAIVDDGGYFGFVVKTPKGHTLRVWVNCDPEGNGPGHLDIQKG